MTVGELIERLQQYPLDQKVLVSGYEYGYAELCFETDRVSYDDDAAYGGPWTSEKWWNYNPDSAIDALIVARDN